jgi:hypothetical protein
MFACEHAMGLCTIEYDDGRYRAYISTQSIVVMQGSVYCGDRRAVSFNLEIRIPFCRDIHTAHSIMQIFKTHFAFCAILSQPNDNHAGGDMKYIP